MTSFETARDALRSFNAYSNTSRIGNYVCAGLHSPSHGRVPEDTCISALVLPNYLSPVQFLSQMPAFVKDVPVLYTFMPEAARTTRE